MALALVGLLLFAGILSSASALGKRPADRDRDGLSDRHELRLSKTSPRHRDTDRDRLSDGYEVRRSKTSPRHRDTDRDRLSDGYEVRRSKTSPRHRDTDRDRLSDGYEVRRSKTSPRHRDTDRDELSDRHEIRTSGTDPLKPDTDGDGLTDGQEVLLGHDPRDPSSPAPPASADTTPPETIDSGPSPSTEEPPPPVARYSYSPSSPVTSQEVTFQGSSSSCSATPCTYRWEDDGPDGPGGMQWPLDSGQMMEFTFTEPGSIYARLILTDALGRSDSTVKTLTVSDAPSPPPSPAQCVDGLDNDGDGKIDSPADPGCAGSTDNDESDPSLPPPSSDLPPLGQPSCVNGATNVTAASQLRTELAAGRDACITASIGDVDLSNLSAATVRNVGTSPSGAMGHIRMDSSSKITFRARFRSTKITNSNSITIEQSRIGGTPDNRVLDMLIFIAEPSDDITIRDNDIGWTTADNSGNTGFGIRAYNDSDNLRVERNRIHHIGGDAMQFGLSGDNLLVDRNEVAYAARPPDSNEHSDDLQIMGTGPGARVTNNYFHHCGWFTASGPTTGCNALAIHAGWDGLLYENNYQGDALGIPDLGDLGTGGCDRSNATWRRNTWVNNGTQFASGLDVNYAHCAGSNNAWERNLVGETFGNKYGFAASGTVARDNLVGTYSLDADGDCTAAACNPAGQEPIGYRKPSGVHW